MLKNYVKSVRENKRFWLLPLLGVTWNQSVYYGGRYLTTHRHHYSFVTAFDEKIPLLNWMVSVYFICFGVWAMVYLYMASREKQAAYTFFLADFLGKAICLFFFLILPTTMERPLITGDGMWDVFMRHLYQVDAADNLFPSIHCMVSWFCWIGVRKRKNSPVWYRYGMLLFAIAVCASTVTTKQHVLLDVVGGIFFAEVSYVAAQRVLAKYRVTDCDRIAGTGLKERVAEK